MAEMNPPVKDAWDRFGAALAERRFEDARKLVDALLDAARTQEANDPEFDVREMEFAACFHLSQAYIAAERFSDAEAAALRGFQAATARAEAKPEDSVRHDQVAQALSNLGTTLLAAQRPDEAADRLRAAIGIWQRLPPDPQHANRKLNHGLAWHNLAYARRENPPEAVDAFRQAQLQWRRFLRRQQHERVRFDLARSWLELSSALQNMNDAEGALAATRSAVADLDDLSRRCPDLPQIAEGLADARRQEAELAHALAQHRTILDAKIAALPPIPSGPVSPEQAAALRHAGSELLEAAAECEQWRRPDLAERAYRRAYDFHRDLRQVDPHAAAGHAQAEAAYRLAILFRDTARPDSSEESQRISIGLLEELARTFPDQAIFRQRQAAGLNDLGLLLQNGAHLAAAEEAFEHARALREASLRQGDDIPTLVGLGGTLCNLGNVACDRFDQTAAVALYDRSLAILNDVLNRDPENAFAIAFRDNATAARERAANLPSPPQMPATFGAIPSPASFGPRPWLPPEIDARTLEQLQADARSLRPDAGWPLLQRTFGKGKDDPNAWYVLGLVRGGFFRGASHEREPWDERRCELALDAFAQAIARRPNFGEARLYRGCLFYRRFLTAQASLHLTWETVRGLDDAQRRLAMEPLHRWASDAYFRTRDALDAAAALLPESALPWLTLARAFRDAGDEPRVIESLREALRRDPDLAADIKEEFPFLEEGDLQD